MDIRNFRWEDLPRIVELMNQYAQAHGRLGSVTLEQIERSWRSPYNHPEDDVFIAQALDGSLIGYAIADLLDNPKNAFGEYCVLPGYQEAGRNLMQAATERFRRQAQVNASPNKPIIMDWRIPAENAEGIALCQERNLELVRQFYTMRIALDQPMTALPLPAGYVRRPFSAEDMPVVYQAKTVIFEDHWGEQHDTLDEWQQDIAHANFDPDLWWIIWHGDEIAGLLWSQPAGREVAWVAIVGVAHAHRRRGLAQIMLKQCFLAYQQRGFRSVHLGVDSNSLTDAVRVYERAGMHIHNTILYYRQVL